MTSKANKKTKRKIKPSVQTITIPSDRRIPGVALNRMDEAISIIARFVGSNPKQGKIKTALTYLNLARRETKPIHSLGIAISETIFDLEQSLQDISEQLSDVSGNIDMLDAHHL